MSRTRRSRRARTVVATTALLLGVVGSACGSDSVSPTTTAAGTSPGTSPASGSGSTLGGTSALLPPPDGSDLPPNNLAPLGVRMTRAALVDTSDGGYEFSDTGTHLALYVAPVGEPFSAEHYADTIAPLSNLITPDVFARWPGLVSYDICQEGEPTDPDRDAEPPTVSQINVERDALGLLDWSDATLEELIRTAARNRSVRLLMSREVRATEAVRAILPNTTPGTGPASADQPTPTDGQ